MRLTRLIATILCIASLQIAMSTIQGCIGSGSEIYIKVDHVNAGIVDYRGAAPHELAGDSITARAFGILLETKNQYHYEKRAALNRMTGAGVAWAMDPYIIITRIDTVRSVALFRIDEQGTVADVGANFVAGRITRLSVDTARRGETIYNSIHGFQSAADILNGEMEASLDVDLMLREKIDEMKGNRLRFIVEVELADGRRLRDTTRPITLL